MRIELLIHLDRVPEGDPNFVWWAESDGVAGFSAAADHLPELLTRAKDALASTYPGEEIELVSRFAPRPVDEADVDQVAGELLDGLELRDSVTLVPV